MFSMTFMNNVENAHLAYNSATRSQRSYWTITKLNCRLFRSYYWCSWQSQRFAELCMNPRRQTIRALQTVTQVKWKKALGETQTLRAGRSKSEPKKIAPPQTPFPGARDGQNLLSWRWSLYLYLQTQFGEDRCTQFRVIVVTDQQTQTNPQTHTQTNKPTDWTDYNTLCRSYRAV